MLAHPGLIVKPLYWGGGFCIYKTPVRLIESITQLYGYVN